MVQRYCSRAYCLVYDSSPGNPRNRDEELIALHLMKEAGDNLDYLVATRCMPKHANIVVIRYLHKRHVRYPPYIFRLPDGTFPIDYGLIGSQKDIYERLSLMMDFTCYTVLGSMTRRKLESELLKLIKERNNRKKRKIG